VRGESGRNYCCFELSICIIPETTHDRSPASNVLWPESWLFAHKDSRRQWRAPHKNGVLKECGK
jgi:hypothetical protein